MLQRSGVRCLLLLRRPLLLLATLGARTWRSSPSIERLMAFRDFLDFLEFLETSEVAGPGPNPREIEISFGAEGPLACARPDPTIGWTDVLPCVFVCVWGRYPPAAALLVRRLVVPVLNKLLQLPLHPLAGAWRVCSSSGKGPRGKIESLARCLSPPRACPPLAGGLVAVVVPRVRRADCPLSSGCCVTAPAAYPPRAPEWSTAALCGGRKLQRSTLAACFRLCRPLLLSCDFRGA